MIWRGAFLQILLCSIAMTTDINAGRLNDENYIETNTVKGDQLVIFILPEQQPNYTGRPATWSGRSRFRDQILGQEGFLGVC